VTEAMTVRVSEPARAEGLAFRLEQAEVEDGLFRAHFTDGR
jgi:hypothetical protein